MGYGSQLQSRLQDVQKSLNNKNKSIKAKNTKTQNNKSIRKPRNVKKPSSRKNVTSHKVSKPSLKKESHKHQVKTNKRKNNASIRHSLIWNCQLDLRDVATLYAIQKSQHLHSRSDALHELIHVGLSSIIKDPSDNGSYNPMNNTIYGTFYNSFILAHKATAKTQFHKWHSHK